MLPRIVVTLMLAAPVAALAQYATIGPNGQVAPAGSTVIVVGSGTGPVLNTPSVTFSTPAGTTGISLADRAGASASTVSTVPSTPESVPVSNFPNTGSQPVAAESAGSPGVNNEGRLINDAGPSYYAGARFAGGAAEAPAGATAANIGSASLGEVAAKYKSNRPQNIRTYTNADAQRLSDSMNVRGANPSPVSAQNAPASTPQTQAYSGPATPSGVPQLSAAVRPSPIIRDENAQAGTGAQPSGAATAKEQSATTPQTSQPAAGAPNNGEEAGNRLPATSTLLPLFGLLGAASGAIGLWLRKHRS